MGNIRILLWESRHFDEKYICSIDLRNTTTCNNKECWPDLYFRTAAHTDTSEPVGHLIGLQTTWASHTQTVALTYLCLGRPLSSYLSFNECRTCNLSNLNFLVSWGYWFISCLNKCMKPPFLGTVRRWSASLGTSEGQSSEVSRYCPSHSKLLLTLARVNPDYFHEAPALPCPKHRHRQKFSLPSRLTHWPRVAFWLSKGLLQLPPKTRLSPPL